MIHGRTPEELSPEKTQAAFHAGEHNRESNSDLFEVEFQRLCCWSSLKKKSIRIIKRKLKMIAKKKKSSLFKKKKLFFYDNNT